MAHTDLAPLLLGSTMTTGTRKYLDGSFRTYRTNKLLQPKRHGLWLQSLSVHIVITNWQLNIPTRSERKLRKGRVGLAGRISRHNGFGTQITTALRSHFFASIRVGR